MLYIVPACDAVYSLPGGLYNALQMCAASTACGRVEGPALQRLRNAKLKLVCNQSINQLHVFLARGEPKKGSHSQTTFGGS
jgi:hypothetical protein